MKYCKECTHGRKWRKCTHPDNVVVISTKERTWFRRGKTKVLLYDKRPSALNKDNDCSNWARRPEEHEY